MKWLLAALVVAVVICLGMSVLIESWWALMLACGGVGMVLGDLSAHLGRSRRGPGFRKMSGPE